MLYIKLLPRFDNMKLRLFTLYSPKSIILDYSDVQVMSELPTW